MTGSGRASLAQLLLRGAGLVAPRSKARPADGDARAARRRSADRPAAAGGPDDRVGDGQAQAGAAGLIGGAMEAVEDAAAFLFGDPGPGVVDGERARGGPRRPRATATRRPRASTCRRCRAARRPAGRAIRAGRSTIASVVAPEPRRPRRRAAGRGSRPPPRIGRPSGRPGRATSTGSASGCPPVESNRASQSMSSTRRRVRFSSASIRPKASASQAGSRARARASVVWASMTESGVRSSCEASAVNSSWRWRARSIGVATRRPIASAAQEDHDQERAADPELGHDQGRLGLRRRPPWSGRRRRSRRRATAPWIRTLDAADRDRLAAR